jgi:hypothetical protein
MQIFLQLILKKNPHSSRNYPGDQQTKGNC